MQNIFMQANKNNEVGIHLLFKQTKKKDKVNCVSELFPFVYVSSTGIFQSVSSEGIFDVILLSL